MHLTKKLFWLLTLLLILPCLPACEQQQPEPEAPHTHTFGVWETVLEGTCVSKGKQTRSCACGETEERPHLSDHSYAASNICTICGDFKHCTDGILNYTSNGDGTCYVSGHNTQRYEKVVEIPRTSPDGDLVTTIGQHAFEDNANMETLVIPDHVTEIAQYAFYNCSRLKNITIGEGVTVIGKGAFEKCTAVTRLNWNATAPYDAKDWNGIFSMLGQAGNGVTVRIGANVTRIPAYLFYPTPSNEMDFTPNITSVIFADNSVCSTIGDYAFYGCKYLATFSLPASVTNISYRAFGGCTALRELTVAAVYPDTLQDSILTWPFWKYDVYMRVETLIVTGNTAICADAFEGCNAITTVVLADSITDIGNRAFYRCENLTAVYYYGTESAWQTVTLGEQAFEPTAVIYYYSETQPAEGGNYWHYVDGVPTKW